MSTVERRINGYIQGATVGIGKVTVLLFLVHAFVRGFPLSWTENENTVTLPFYVPAPQSGGGFVKSPMVNEIFGIFFFNSVVMKKI
jgi:hypothetical protein